MNDELFQNSIFDFGANSVTQLETSNRPKSSIHNKLLRLLYYMIVYMLSFQLMFNYCYKREYTIEIKMFKSRRILPNVETSKTTKSPSIVNQTQ